MNISLRAIMKFFTITILVSALLFGAIVHAVAPEDRLEKIEENIPFELTKEYAEIFANTISELETNGNCNMKGKSGEIGCHQFMPSTWKAYSKEVFGEIKDQTKESSHTVVVEKIYKWKQQGYSDKDILLTWNQGNKGPCKTGTNKYGVKYDSCAYYKKGLTILSKKINEKTSFQESV